MPNRPLHPAVRVPLVLALGSGASLASIFLFGILADEILENESLAVDERGLALAQQMRSPAADRLFAAITSTGEPWALAAATGLAALRWLPQGRQADTLTLLALGTGGGGVINEVLKHFFHRQRPPLKLQRAHATGYSFPSGHTMTTLALYGTLAALVTRRGAKTGHRRAALIWAPVLLLCALVGWSRVYLEVHYPTDVIGGWAAGTIWVATCGLARTFMEPEES